MSSISRKIFLALLGSAALAVVLSLAACSRGTDSLAGPGRDVATQNKKHPKPPAPPPAADPCASMTGFGGAMVVTSASVPQFRPTRLRIDLAGDVTQGTLGKVQTCALANVPAVSFISGSVTVSGSGTFTFGPLTVPVPAEAGTVLASDAAGNVIQIIWPAIATPLVPGPPILRVNLANSSVFQAGSTINATISVVARAPDGTTATISASGANMVVPPLKL